MIQSTELEALMQLRKYLFDAIKVAVEEPGSVGGKSYEGTFSIILPGYYEQEDRNCMCLHLDLYLIGPIRHYNWWGNTLLECIKQAQKDITTWVKEDREQVRD